jgi:hypothetical protein
MRHKRYGRFGLGLPTISRNKLTMAGPPGPAVGRPEDKLHDPAIQRARVCGHISIIGSRTLACWMAGSEAGHGEKMRLYSMQNDSRPPTH